MHACVPVPMSYEAPLNGPSGRGAPLIGNANIQTTIKIKKRPQNVTIEKSTT